MERHPSRMASARLFGKEWTAFAFPKDMAFLLDANENVNGHDCWKVVGRSEQDKQQTTLWVDMTLGAVRKLDSVYDDCQVTILYDTIRINPTLHGNEFTVSNAVKKKADERQN